MYYSHLVARLKYKAYCFSAPVKYRTHSVSTKVASPITAYREAVDAGQIESDNHQLKVVDKLEELFLSLDKTDADLRIHAKELRREALPLLVPAGTVSLKSTCAPRPPRPAATPTHQSTACHHLVVKLNWSFISGPHPAQARQARVGGAGLSFG